MRAEPLLEVTGRLERREGTINVLAERVGAAGATRAGPRSARASAGRTPDVRRAARGRAARKQLRPRAALVSWNNGV